LLLTSPTSGIASSPDNELPKKIRIAAFNYYPSIFKDKDGEIKGIDVDLLRIIAEHENWELEFIWGTWAEGLERIKNGQVDLLTNAAFTNERSKFLDYCKIPKTTVWTEIYVPLRSSITQIKDLEGKTIATMKGDYNGESFYTLTQKLGINCNILYFNDFDNVFKAIDSEKCDAGVINCLFGNAKMPLYRAKASGIIYNSFEIFYASAKDKNADILSKIDYHLSNWKKIQNSPYYTIQQKWIHKNINLVPVIPAWIKYGVATLITLLLVCFILILLYNNKIKNATQEIAQRENRLRDIFQAAQNVAFVTTDTYFPQSNVIGFSPGAERILGYEMHEIIGKPFSYLYANEQVTLFNTLQNQLRDNNQSIGYEGETELVKASGEKVPVIFTAYPLFDSSSNKKYAFLFVFIDISERLKVEQALRQSEERMRQMAETIQNVFFLCNKDGFLYVSPAYEKIWERTCESLYQNQLSFLENIYEEDRLKLIQLTKYKSINTISYFDNDFRIKTNSSALKWIHVKIFPIFDNEGNVIRQTGIATDITKQKLIENELVKAKEKAEESDRLKTSFLQNISHEIRTPMNGILGFSELLCKPGLSDEKRKSYNEIIRNSGQYLLQIINDVLDISQIETSQVNIINSYIDVNKILISKYKFYALQAEKKNIKLIFEPNPELQSCLLYSDDVKIKHILNNLITNAIKFTHNGSVTFGCKLSENKLVFFVQDTGIGISAENQNIIFERFRQIENSSHGHVGGSGLGLAITKAYVELLGGKIWMESKLNVGSCFYFSLPLGSAKSTKQTENKYIS
jgi:PAS domain S-box-containing protein